MNIFESRPFVCALLLAGALALAPARAEIQIINATADGAAPPAPGIRLPAPTNATAAGAARKADELIFRNGDLLRGLLLEAAPDRGVVWKHPDVSQPIEFAATNVVQVKLGEPPAAPPLPRQAIVRLTNEDELRGRIVSLTEAELVLETWYAGTMTLRRAMIASILPNASAGSTVYVGPASDDEWQSGRQRGGWDYRDGAFVSAGSGAIGRDLKLPALTRFEFDLAWRNFPYLQVAFHTDNLEQVYGNCYMLQVSGNTVYLQRGRNRNFNNIGGATNVENLQQRSKARFSLLIDKEKKTVALFIDNELVKQWVDPGEFAGGGSGVVFQSQGQGPVRLSNIVVSEWDGQFPSAGETVAREQDVIRFINNDKVSGQLKTITKDAITFVTAFATLDVPLERAAQIDFASEKAERARRQARDVLAVFHTGGRVTVALDKLDDKALAGASENFGPLSLNRAAFQELRFHIYDDTIKLGGRGDEW